MELETLVLHGLDDRQHPYSAVVEPIVMSTTFERSKSGGFENGYSYCRLGNPNRSALEQLIAKVEGGSAAFAFASGSAAAMALFQILSPGDHVIVPRDCYHGTQSILGEIFARWNLAASFVDMTDISAVEAAIRSTTRMIWIETPSNPLLRVCDIAALSNIATKINAVTVIDNTVATPVLQKPFLYGCDFILHSTTKAISGHSDVLGGVVIARVESQWSERLGIIQSIGGGVPSPFDCWLTLRGIRTMPLRVRSASETALEVAKFLLVHPMVEACHYPGLSNHPHHLLASKQMTDGFGALLSFEIVGGQELAIAVTNRLKLIRRATSLGGIESLIEHRASIEPPSRGIPRNLLRLSIGLESAKDLISDLDMALRT